MAFGQTDLAIVINAKDKASGTFKKIGGSLGKLAKVGAVGVAALGVAAGGATIAAVKMAAGYEKAMKEVASLGVPVDQMKVLEAGVLDLSRQLGVDAVEATGALYQAISAGVPPENALAFLQVASKAAIAGVTDAETAVDGISTVMNAFASQNLSAAQAADLMFATVKGGKTTFEELSSSLANVAPLANATGVQFSEVSAALATMTASGTATTVATTQIRSAIQSLTRPSAELTTLFNEAGFASGEAAVQQLGFAGAAEIVSTATGGSVAGMTKLLGSIEGVQGVLGVTGDQAETFAANMDAMANSAGAADAAFDTMSGSFDFQMSRVGAAFKTGMIEVGLQILPVLTPIIETLADTLPIAIETTVGKITAFTTGIQDVIRDVGLAGGVFEILKQGIEGNSEPLGLIAETFEILRGPIDTLSAGLALMGDAWAKMAPILEPVGAALKDIASNVLVLFEALGPLIPRLVGMLLPGWVTFLSLAGKLLPILQTFGEKIMPTITEVVGKLSAAWDKVFGGDQEGPGLFADLTEKGKELAEMLATSVVPFIKELGEKFELIVPKIQEFIETLKTNAQVLLDELGPGLQMLGDTLTNVILPLLQPFIDLLVSTGEMLMRLVEPVQNVVMALLEGLKPIMDVLLTEVLPVLLELWGELATQFEEQILPLVEEVVEALEEALVPAIEIISKVVTFLLEFALIPYYNFVKKYIIPIVVTVARVLLTVLRDALRFIAKLLTGDFAGAWTALQTLVSNVINGIIGLFGQMVSAVTGAVSAIIGAVRNMATEIKNAVKDIPVLGGVVGGLGGLLGFQHGGSFTVGGSGGADSQTVAFRATPGERVSVTRPGGGGGGGGGTTIIVQGSLVSERQLSEVIVEVMRDATRLNESVLDVNAVVA
jgi:TP901 family phage tail tape measure protein